MLAGLDKDALLHRIANGIIGSQIFLKMLEFNLSWQMQMPQQINHLFKTRMVLYQFRNIVACIRQGIIHNLANPSITGNGIF